MSFDAGSITSTLGLDVSPFAQGMLEANAIASVFPATVQTFLANPLLGLIKVAEDAAGAIKSAFLEIGHAADNAGEAAERAGVSTEFLTGVGAVAKDSGSSVQGLGDAMKFLNNNAADAASGKADAAKAFKDIGVSVTDASGKLKNGEQIFFEVADAMAGLESPALKTQAAMNLMGRGGTELIPTLNKGSAGIRAFSDQVAALGGTIGTDLAAAGDKFGTLDVLIDAAWTGIKKTIAQPILQYFADHFEQITGYIQEASEGIRDSIEAIMPSLVKMIPTMIEIGSAIFNGLAKGLQIVTPIISSLLPLVEGLANVVGSVLAPAFAALEPVLSVVSKVLSTIFEVMGKILSGVGGVIRGVTDGLGITETTPAAVAEAAKRRATVNVAQVNVAAIDTSDATTQIAAKIKTPLQEGVREQQKALSRSAHSAAFVARRL